MVYEKIDQIFKNGKRLVDDFTDADLSKLDLSSIDPKYWEGAIFKNTNFKGTNIKFYPNDLKVYYLYEFMKSDPDYQYYSISGCNFEDCDLSYLKDNDLQKVMISNCNFKNTKLHIDFTNPIFQKNGCYNYAKNKLVGVTLPTAYSKKKMEYWDDLDLDFDFLKKNPHISVSSKKILDVIRKTLEPDHDKIHTIKDYEKRILTAKEILEYDRQGDLKRFYQMMKPYFNNIVEEENFFLGNIRKKSFKKLDLSNLSSDMLLQFYFGQCDFQHLYLPFDFKVAREKKEKLRYASFLSGKSNNIEKLTMPITIHNWDNKSDTRVLNSGITIQTNLYVELERICNMKCSFCRNLGLGKQKYNYRNIVKNLKAVYEHINNIVIGGGEPTLLVNDLISLKKDVTDTYSDRFYVITNGSLSVSDYQKLIDDYTLYISRHSTDDLENRAIFGDKNNRLLSAEELTEIPKEGYYNHHTLCCTCFKGGVDTEEKMINYIKFAQELGYHNVLFQTLHQEENFGNNNIGQIQTIDSSEILNTLGYLNILGFNISKPIYSTSGYELHIAKKEENSMNISFKEYKNPKEIKQQWYQSPKRCFDLSMAPNGEIYESWDQQQQPIKIKKCTFVNDVKQKL